MSPASKSKSKDKSTPKTGKEHSKISMKPSTLQSSSGHGSPGSAYNPAMGTFHTLEMSSSSFSPPQTNGRFRTIDDPDNHSTSSQGTTAEYDSLSNNSCSGESDDHKDKPTITLPQAEAILCYDNDKRDKNRQKNERKHQRQKEKRAQELHERCTAFLTSRKLEALSHQLVSMGFPADRATMAVIINKGRMEECVAWLLHEEDDNKQQVSFNLEDKSCVTIDIADELAKITKMEVKYNCLRQDVERVVVACEGDLLKAEENLRAQKKATSAPKPDESFDSIKLNDKEATPNNSPALVKNPIKGSTSIAIAQRQEGRDYSISKTVPNPTDWPRIRAAPFDKRWLSTSTPILSVSPTQTSAPPSKREARFGASSRDLRSISPANAPKAPFIVMQRPKEQLPSTEILTAANKVTVMGRSDPTLQQFYPRNNLQAMPSSPAELLASTRLSSQLWNSSVTSSSPLTTMLSPGLFTGWGLSSASELPSPNSWNTCSSTPKRDYTSIDWSLDLTSSRPSMKIDDVSDTWSTMFMGGNAKPPAPPPLPPQMNGGGIHFPGLQQVGGLISKPSVPGSLKEWSPFEGRDLFRVTRKLVTSPSI